MPAVSTHLTGVAIAGRYSSIRLANLRYATIDILSVNIVLQKLNPSEMANEIKISMLLYKTLDTSAVLHNFISGMIVHGLQQKARKQAGCFVILASSMADIE